MEKAMEKEMEEAFRIPGVSGMMCVDKNGLCLGAKGNITRQASGSISTLARQAAQLNKGDSSTTPVVYLESEAGSVLIKSTGDLTTAMFKTF